MNANPIQLSQHQKLLKSAHQWVAQTFYGSMLKQMRNSPFKSDLFSGGRGGEMFGSMLDQKLAERMSRGAGGKLAENLVKRIEHRHGNKNSTPPVTLSAAKGLDSNTTGILRSAQNDNKGIDLLH